MSEFIWYNSHIKVDNKPIYFNLFSEKKLNFIGQLFDSADNLKNCDVINLILKTIRNFHGFKWFMLYLRAGNLS